MPDGSVPSSPAHRPRSRRRHCCLAAPPYRRPPPVRRCPSKLLQLETSTELLAAAALRNPNIDHTTAARRSDGSPATVRHYPHAPDFATIVVPPLHATFSPPTGTLPPPPPNPTPLILVRQACLWTTGAARKLRAEDLLKKLTTSLPFTCLLILWLEDRTEHLPR
jgi:hypothetical protein